MGMIASRLGASRLGLEWVEMRRQARVKGPIWALWQLLLTALALLVVWLVLSNLLRWVLRDANWEVIAVNLRLYGLGAYPKDLVWRPGLALVLVASLLGASAAVWGETLRGFSRLLAATLLLLLLLPPAAPLATVLGSPALSAAMSAFGAAAPWLGAALVGLVGPAMLLRRWMKAELRDGALDIAESRRGKRAGRALRWSWMLSPIVVGLLLRGAGAETGALRSVVADEWGGLLLTLALAAASIGLSFPLGVLLALGRRSALPLVRLVSIAWIELVRGVPLVTVLYMVALLTPLILPEGWSAGDVLRAVFGLTAFASAYVAEDVRGGLASVGRGQYEAARALGLSTVKSYRLIVLPQALRAVVPAIVGQFISLFKDTSLAIIIGLRELLGIARTVVSQDAYVGLYRESLFFIAIIYFVFSYAMSRASRSLEAGAERRDS